MYQARIHMKKCRPLISRAGRVLVFSAAVVVAGALAAHGCGLWPSGSADRPDPVQFAIRLTSLGDDRDWKGLRDLMVADYHGFDLEALMWAVTGQSISPVDISRFPDLRRPRHLECAAVRRSLHSPIEGCPRHSPSHCARREWAAWSSTPGRLPSEWPAGWTHSMPEVSNCTIWTIRPWMEL